MKRPVSIPVTDAFIYADGVLLHKYGTQRKAVGDVVGLPRKRDGYIQFKHEGRKHFAHRVIWQIFNGPIPDGMEIDHIDGEQTNNRIENLRLVSREENARNLKTQSRNKTGTPGIIFMNNRYRVTIGAEYLGYFDTLDEAVRIRKAAEARLGFHANHGRK